LARAEEDAEVPGGSIVIAEALVDAGVAGSSVVMGVAMVDISVGGGVAIPVCKPPRKLPAAMEMPRSNRLRCIMPSTEAFHKSGAMFSWRAWPRAA